MQASSDSYEAVLQRRPNSSDSLTRREMTLHVKAALADAFAQQTFLQAGRTLCTVGTTCASRSGLVLPLDSGSVSSEFLLERC